MQDAKVIWSWPKDLGIYSTSCCQAILNVIKARETEKRSTMHKKQCSSCFELSIINAQILATRRMIRIIHLKAGEKNKSNELKIETCYI